MRCALNQRVFEPNKPIWNIFVSWKSRTWRVKVKPNGDVEISFATKNSSDNYSKRENIWDWYILPNILTNFSTLTFECRFIFPADKLVRIQVLRWGVYRWETSGYCMVDMSGGLSIYSLFSQSVNQSVGQSISQSVTQSGSQSVSQSFSQSVSQSVS